MKPALANVAPPAAPTGQRSSQNKRGFAAACIGLLVLAAYHNALPTPFVFDDQFAIVENPTIRHLEKVGEVLRPPAYAAGAAGRPLVNLTLAINYAIGALQPWGYHAVNIGLHMLTGLTLFGVLRRTLEKSSPAGDSCTFALAASAVWIAHPLQTESVTCVIQRDEILAGLCYLLTLYCFIRGTAPPGGKWWLPLAALCCLLGMAAKEIMVSAPLMVLLYDRTYVAGTCQAAWGRRRRLACGLAASWLGLAALMLTSQQRGGTVGFGLGVSAWDYLLTQCRAIILYLRLALWPHPLVVDYGTDLTTRVQDVVPQATGLSVLAVGTVLGIHRRHALGFWGAWLFAILAPSSSVVPLVTQPIAEHRMYLPLVAVSVVLVAGLRRAVGPRGLLVLPVLVLGFVALTIQRNEEYRNEALLTAGALAANPRNDRAYLNLGTLASRDGRVTDAIAYYEKALRLNPGAADTHINLAAVLEQTGQVPEALKHYREAVRLRPEMPAAQYRLGLALARTGPLEDAIGPLEHALRLQPDSWSAQRALAWAHVNCGNARAQAGRMSEAVAHYEAALKIEPRNAQAHNNLANALSQMGRPADAIAHYQTALQIQPDHAEAHYNLAAELMAAGRLKEARAHLVELLRLRPDDAQARRNLSHIDAVDGNDGFQRQ